MSSSATAPTSHRLYRDRSVPFGKMLSQRAIGVLVRPSLPRTVRIAGIDADSGGIGEVRMSRHFLPPPQSQVNDRWRYLGRGNNAVVNAPRTAPGPCPASAGPFFRQSSAEDCDAEACCGPSIPRHPVRQTLFRLWHRTIRKACLASTLATVRTPRASSISASCGEVGLPLRGRCTVLDLPAAGGGVAP